MVLATRLHLVVSTTDLQPSQVHIATPNNSKRQPQRPAQFQSSRPLDGQMRFSTRRLMLGLVQLQSNGSLRCPGQAERDPARTRHCVRLRAALPGCWLGCGSISGPCSLLLQQSLLVHGLAPQDALRTTHAQRNTVHVMSGRSQQLCNWSCLRWSCAHLPPCWEMRDAHHHNTTLAPDSVDMCAGLHGVACDACVDGC